MSVFRRLVVGIFLVVLGMTAGEFRAYPEADRPEITGISHVTLFADDLATSEKFYGSLLGWEQVQASDAQKGVRFYANHLQYVELLSPPRAGQPVRLDAVGFVTNNADQLRRYLGARGLSVPDQVSNEANGSLSFVVRDPEGNKVEFTQPGHLFPPAPRNGSQPVSSHILHAGYQVHDRAALDHFYKDLLGFHLYWQGGAKEGGHIDWVMMQVPNGTDWIEYMLYLPADPTREQLGSADHLAPGVQSVTHLQEQLEAKGWTPGSNVDPKVLGVDGKLQLDLHDPDGTRVEFMEYMPVKKACCSAYTGTQPTPDTGW